MLQNFSTAGSGLSKWTFAEKGGRTYFLKEFLSPVYPVRGAPGSKETHERRRRACDEFEKRTKGIMKATPQPSVDGGNLVITQVFFRSGTKYYKATTQVTPSPLSLAQLAELPDHKRILLFKTICHSLRALHAARIVHGDLRPENVLIVETMTGDCAGKLIDFDSSFFAGKPPAVEAFKSDPIYYAPEVGLYIEGVAGVHQEDIHTAADIFSLGLLFCQYLTAALPPFEQDVYRLPYVAAVAGVKLKAAGRKGPAFLRQLIATMLQADPAARPTIEQIFATLQDPAVPLATPGAKSEKPKTKPSAGKLKGTMTNLAVESSTTAVPEGDSEPPVKPPSKLKGTLTKRDKK